MKGMPSSGIVTVFRRSFVVPADASKSGDTFAIDVEGFGNVPGGAVAYVNGVRGSVLRHGNGNTASAVNGDEVPPLPLLDGAVTVFRWPASVLQAGLNVVVVEIETPSSALPPATLSPPDFDFELRLARTQVDPADAAAPGSSPHTAYAEPPSTLSQPPTLQDSLATRRDPYAATVVLTGAGKSPLLAEPALRMAQASPIDDASASRAGDVSNTLQTTTADAPTTINAAGVDAVSTATDQPVVGVSATPSPLSLPTPTPSATAPSGVSLMTSTDGEAMSRGGVIGVVVAVFVVVIAVLVLAVHVVSRHRRRQNQSWRSRYRDRSATVDISVESSLLPRGPVQVQAAEVKEVDQSDVVLLTRMSSRSSGGRDGKPAASSTQPGGKRRPLVTDMGVSIGVLNSAVEAAVREAEIDLALATATVAPNTAGSASGMSSRDTVRACVGSW